MPKLMMNPWEAWDTVFPVDGTPTEKLRLLLNYAVLAPSIHNSQPWLFKLVDDSVELYVDTSRSLHVADPDDRELVISCGAALFNIRIAIRHFGYMAPIENFPTSRIPMNTLLHIAMRRFAHKGALDAFPMARLPKLLARVHLGATTEATPEEHMLFQSIHKRRTNRHAFENREVPEEILLALQEAAGDQGAWFDIVRGDEPRNTLVDLIAKGDRIQYADKRFRHELSAWVHPSNEQTKDGIPGYALDRGDVMSYIRPLVVRTFDMGNGVAANDRQLAEGSPVLAVLGTYANTASDWLLAGQTLSRILLYARAKGVWASFLNQPIEVTELQGELSRILGRKTSDYPQIVLRMGYGQDVLPTPRRTVDEVLL